MGFKEDKREFLRKVLDEDLTAEEILKGLDETNPWFLKTYLSNLLGHEAVTDKITEKAISLMKPTWIGFYLQNYQPDKYELKLALPKLNDAQIYKYVFENPKFDWDEKWSETKSEIINQITDDEILKKIAFQHPKYAQEALPRLTEPLTAEDYQDAPPQVLYDGLVNGLVTLTKEEYLESQDPAIRYHGVVNDVIDDMETIKWLFSVNNFKKIPEEPVEIAKNLLEKFGYDRDKEDWDDKDEKKDKFIKNLTYDYGDLSEPVMDLILDGVGDNKNFYVNTRLSHQPHVIKKIIERFDDDEFTMDLAHRYAAEYAEQFGVIAPLLDQEELRQVFNNQNEWGSEKNKDQHSGDLERAQINVLTYLENDLMVRILNNHEDLSPRVARIALNKYIAVNTKDSKPLDEKILKKIAAGEEDYGARKALEYITDVGFLEKLVLDDDAAYGRRQIALNALKKTGNDITDVLETIIEDPKDPLQHAAFQIYTTQEKADQKFYEKIAWDDGEMISENRRTIIPGALSFITDEKFLEKFMLEKLNFTVIAYKVLLRMTTRSGDLKESNKFVEDIVLKAKDERIAKTVFQDWAKGNLKDDIELGKKAIEKYPAFVTWVLKNVDKDTLPEDFVLELSKMKPRSYDEPQGVEQVTDEKVPAHKQQLLRLLLTLAKPA